MKHLAKAEISKLEKGFNETNIKESWYYEALQRIVNNSKNTNLPILQNSTKDLSIDKMKHELIRYAHTLGDNKLINSIVDFIEKNLKNTYYFRAIKETISILKKTEENLTLDEAKNITYKNRTDLSGFEISIINNLLTYFYEEENKYVKIYK